MRIRPRQRTCHCERSNEHLEKALAYHFRDTALYLPWHGWNTGPGDFLRPDDNP